MIYLKLFLTFFKIGLFTFGGGYAMLPLIQAEVEANAWIQAEDFINFVAISESTPGPFAINISTFVGADVGGFFGALVSTLGVVMPSFIIILVVARCYAKFKSNVIVKGCMSGLKPAAIGLIASAVITMAVTVFFEGNLNTAVFTTVPFYLSLAIFTIMSVVSFLKVHPIIIITASAVLGIVLGYALNLPV